MLSGIVNVSLHVQLPCVPSRCQEGASIEDFLKEDVYLSLGICDEVSDGA